MLSRDSLKVSFTILTLVWLFNFKNKTTAYTVNNASLDK